MKRPISAAQTNAALTADRVRSRLRRFDRFFTGGKHAGEQFESG